MSQPALAPAPTPAPLARPAAAFPRQPAARLYPVQRRRRFLPASFLLAVLLPAALTAGYLYLFAADQYHSEAAFSVRSEEFASPVAGLLGAITQVGSGSASEADILFDYIRSPAMIAAVGARVDLRGVFAGAADDPVFALQDDATAEDLGRYWGRMVHVAHDYQAGILSLRVEAFRPADARDIAQAILDESTRLVNDLSDQARRDAIRFASADLAEAETALRSLRAALADFRRTHRLADPAADVAGRMGVLGALEAELAQALVERDTVRSYAEAEDHRVVQADRRIAAIGARIEAERESLGIGAPGEALPDVLGRYEELLTDIEFAQTAYTQALSNLALARAEARRQARYLAVHIPPTLAETALYPRRAMLSGLTALFLLLGWAAAAVVIYNVRDGRG